jgi:hypothetical protein
VCAEGAPTGIDAAVWDGAPSRRDEHLVRIGLPRIALQPYSPELNPAERVFEEPRRQIEGRVYPALDDKVASVVALLRDPDADPARVQRLTGWGWIHAAAAKLRAPGWSSSIAASVNRTGPRSPAARGPAHLGSGQPSTTQRPAALKVAAFVEIERRRQC